MIPEALPYVHEEIAAEPYVHEEIAAEPYEHVEIEAEPYVAEDEAEAPAALPYVHEEIAAEPYVQRTCTSSSCCCCSSCLCWLSFHLRLASCHKCCRQGSTSLNHLCHCRSHLLHCCSEDWMHQQCGICGSMCPVNDFIISFSFAFYTPKNSFWALSLTLRLMRLNKQIHTDFENYEKSNINAEDTTYIHTCSSLNYI